VQALAYFKFYPLDRITTKSLVFTVWFMCLCHLTFTSTAIWSYLIADFGQSERIDDIPWSLALTIALTAFLTFLVHSFFVHRIHKLSKRKFYLSVPLGILALSRLAFGSLTTSRMISLGSLERFVETYRWSFTTGLAISAILDVLITVCLCVLLKINQQQDSSLNYVLDTLMLYAFETGSLTCFTTLVSLICWVLMPWNLVFMGLHFVIIHIHANSLLAILNTRKSLGQNSTVDPTSDMAERGLPVIFPDDFQHISRSASSRRVSRAKTVKRASQHLKSTGDRLQISVETTTVCTLDEPYHLNSSTSALNKDVV